MIRPLQEADRTPLTALLMAEPPLNLYMLGNLAAYGFGQEHCEFWGDVRDGVVYGVVNLYMRAGWTVFGRAEADWAGLAGVIDGYALPTVRFQDNPDGIPTLLPYLRTYDVPSIKDEELMELARDAFRPRPAPQGDTVRRATLDDLAKLVAFYADAEEMTRTAEGVERPLRERRIWLAESSGRFAAAALTNAEGAGCAMIGGVYIHPAFRGQGYAQATVGALAGELLNEGIRPILYWHNPPAGAAYRKLGFRRIGSWRAAQLVRRQP